MKVFRLFFCFISWLTLSVTGLSGQTIFALTSNDLLTFDAQNPSKIQQKMPVSGIMPGQSLVGLDVRPNTGELYTMGYNASNGEARLYTIDPSTGVATAIGVTSLALKPGMGKIGFDFNPTVDRIRLTGSDQSNLRIHPVTGALAATDMNLSFAASDVNAAAVPSIGSVAYTNSYIGSTSTTLYNIDDMLGILTTQIPPNNGTLNTVGNTGINFNPNDPSSDIDIWYDAVTRTNKAFLAANTNNDTQDKLYSIDLATGVATLMGNIGNGLPIHDIALMIDRTLPTKITGRMFFALTTNSNLLALDTDQPSVVRRIMPVTGLAAGQLLSGLDFRPATGDLYGLGYNPTTGEGRLYTIDQMTGTATAVGAAAILLKPNMGKISMDFNPTVDRVRVTGSNNSNFRLHPVTGALAATDNDLAFAISDINAGKNPSVGTGAYINSFNGATTTILYNFDDSLNILTTQIPPNNGTLNTIGSSGIIQNLADPSSDMDIAHNQYSGENTAFLVANTDKSTFDNLFKINLITGATTLLGSIGNGIAVTDIAISTEVPETACESKTISCVKYEILRITRDARGNKTYRVKVSNACADAINYVAFQLPNGVSALASTANSNYSSLGGRTYEMRSPSFSPFYSVRFKSTGTGIASGQSDAFEYTLPPTANQAYILASAKAGANNYDSYLSVSSCSVSTGSATRPEQETTNNRTDNTFVQESNDMLIFPNPCANDLFIDLSNYKEQQVTISIYSIQNQIIMQNKVGSGEGLYHLELTDNISDGLYFLETKADNGARVVQRFVVRK